MTFAQMCKLDGRLLALYQEAQKIAGWYGLPKSRGLIGFRYLLAQCVGFGARIEALSTSRAYDIAYQTPAGTLPPCAKGRHCQHRDDYPVPVLTPEQERGIAEGTLVVLKRDPDFEFAPPDDKFAPHDLDAMVDEVFPEAV